MASSNVTITAAGMAALVNAEQTGTNAVKITKVGFGSSNYTPLEEQTELKSQFKELSTISGGAIGDNKIHVTVRDDSSDAYTVNEFGVYLEDGTLFAVGSQPVGSTLQKAAGSMALLCIDFVLQGVSTDLIQFGDTNFLNPPATHEKPGIVVLATNEEIKEGLNDEKVVTAAGFATNATEEANGTVKFATAEEVEAGVSLSKAISPKRMFDFVKQKISAAVDEAMQKISLMCVPIGGIIFYLGTTIPDGYLLLNNATFDKEDFPELYAVLGTNQLPDANGRVLQGTSDPSLVGTYVEAGLPNIWGRWAYLAVHGTEAFAYGAAQYQRSDSHTKAVTQEYPDLDFKADPTYEAAKYNSIYKVDCDTVQPPAIRTYTLIRYQ